MSMGLYSWLERHDSCGVGFVVHIKGNRSHELIENALLIRQPDPPGAVGAVHLVLRRRRVSDPGPGFLLPTSNCLNRA